MAYHDRPRPEEYAAFHAGYVERVPAGDVVAILRQQIRDTAALLARATAPQADYAYAPGKWTVREVVGHLSDAERVMSYRALCVARGDATALPGFDENAYVAAAAFGARTLPDLVAEYGIVRRATLALFGALPAAAWTRRGTANGQPVSVRALACVIAGHELHHRALLEERYLNGTPLP